MGQYRSSISDHMEGKLSRPDADALWARIGALPPAARREALNDLVLVALPLVRFTVARVLLPRHAADVDDTVQVSLVKAIQSLPGAAAPAHLGAWMVSVAARTAIDQLRYRKRRTPVPLDAVDEPSAPEPGAPDPRLPALAEELEKLREIHPEHHAAVVNRFAPEAGPRPDRERQRFSRGLRWLRRRFGMGPGAGPRKKGSL